MGDYSLDEDLFRQYIMDFYDRSNHMYLTKDGQIKNFKSPHPHVLAQMTDNISKEELSEITSPVLIVHGDQDPIVQ